MSILQDLAVGDQFIIGEELFEKITPIKKSCCSHYTAVRVSNGEEIVLKPITPVEPVIKDTEETKE